MDASQCGCDGVCHRLKKEEVGHCLLQQNLKMLSATWHDACSSTLSSLPLLAHLYGPDKSRLSDMVASTLGTLLSGGPVAGVVYQIPFHHASMSSTKTEQCWQEAALHNGVCLHCDQCAKIEQKRGSYWVKLSDPESFSATRMVQTEV